MVELAASNLFEHQLLVGHRLRDSNRSTERRNRGGRCAIDPFDQLDIVLLDEVERQIALNRHRHLGEKIGRALPRVE